MLWNVADGARVARVATQTEFVLPPVFSADGGYVAIAERVEGANPLYSVLRSADASLVASIEGAPDAQGWELGPGGRYVALRGPDTVVRVLETRRGTELRRLAHADAVERLLHAADGGALLTVDRSGVIAAWSLAAARAELGRPLGRTAAAASVSASADGGRLAFTRDDGAVAVLDVAAGAELYRLRLSRSQPVTTTQLAADGGELVTQSGAMLKLWTLPSKSVTPRAALAAGVPTALALDRTSDLLAVGLGQRPIAAHTDHRRGHELAARVFRPSGPYHGRGAERRPRSRRDRRQRRHRARVGRRFGRADGYRHAACGCRRCDRRLERRWPLRRERRGARRPHRRG